MKTKKRSIVSNKTMEAYAFVLPAAIYIAVIMGYPLVYNIILSFENVTVRNFTKGVVEFVGLDNYTKLIGDPTFQLVFKNTIVFTIACLIVQFSLGFAFALFFYQKFTLSGPIRGAILVSYMMPMAVTGLLGKNLFQSTGLINNLLGKIGIAGPEWLASTTYAMPAVIAMNCWVGIPFNMLLLISGLSSISGDVYESASIDGANWIQKFVYITVPLMKGSIMAVLMLGFIYTFKAFDLMYIMTAGGPLNSTDVLGTYAYDLSFTQFKFSEGATTAVILFICLLIIGVFYLRLIMKEDD